MTDKPNKKNIWFSRISTEEEALKVIKEVSIAFYFIAGLQTLIGAFLAPEMVIDGLSFAILATFLLIFKSRVVSILLVLLAASSVVVTAINSITGGGGRNVFLAITIFYFSIKAVEASFLLNKIRKDSHDYKKKAKQVLISGFVLAGVNVISFVSLFIIGFILFGPEQTGIDSKAGEFLTSIAGFNMLLFGVGVVLIIAGIILRVKSKAVAFSGNP